MKSKYVKVACVATVLSMFGMAAYAQFGGIGSKGLLGKKETQSAGAATKTSDEILKEQDLLLQQFASARVPLLSAQVAALEAFGLKTEAAELKSDADALQAGATSSAKEIMDLDQKAKGSSENAVKAIAGKMAESQELDEASKALMAKSVGHFADGVAKETALVALATKLAEEAKSIIESASLAQKASLAASVKPVVNLAAALPKDAKTALDTLGAYVEFCKRHNITLPKEATNLLAGE